MTAEQMVDGMYLVGDEAFTPQEYEARRRGKRNPTIDIRRYLDLPRGHDRWGSAALDTDEVVALRRRALEILAKPRGQRRGEIQRLADEYRISTRTLYRYLDGDITLVEIDGWRALFRTNVRGRSPQPAHPEAPRQMTTWQRSAP